ncbi:MAG TPA: R3H domain-containing nucleic acid-binding protein [Candidatus Paceibacterota bacterium]
MVYPIMDAALLLSITENLLRSLGFADVRVVITESPRVWASISVPDAKALIGMRGETLRALNHLAKRLVETRTGQELRVSFLIDVNGYYEKQAETIRSQARMLAQRARLFKHDVEMPPTSPYERLLIHELFSEDPEIKTESQGEGKFRHVVLKYVEGGKI